MHLFPTVGIRKVESNIYFRENSSAMQIHCNCSKSTTLMEFRIALTYESEEGYGNSFVVSHIFAVLKERNPQNMRNLFLSL
jgi:hypothetical protein